MARSTFRCKKCENTSGPSRFWDLRCGKSARCCGAKQIWKLNCSKHTMFGRLLEVDTWKKCTPLWREANFEVKMYKTPHLRATFRSSDVEKVHAVVARSTFGSQKCQKLRVLSHFLLMRWGSDVNNHKNYNNHNHHNCNYYNNNI